MLNQYFANISVLRNNLYNLHFNVSGEGSISFHEKLGDYIVIINKLYDDIGEIIKKYNGYPLLNSKIINDTSSITLLPNQNYNVNEAKSTVFKDFSIINNITNQVGEYSIKNHDYTIFYTILEFSKFLNKQLWLLSIEKK